MRTASSRAGTPPLASFIVRKMVTQLDSVENIKRQRQYLIIECPPGDLPSCPFCATCSACRPNASEMFCRWGRCAPPVHMIRLTESSGRAGSASAHWITRPAINSDPRQHSAAVVIESRLRDQDQPSKWV
jgi:hypothetical protein